MVSYYAELMMKFDSLFDEVRSKQEHKQAMSLWYYRSNLVIYFQTSILIKVNTNKMNTLLWLAADRKKRCGG